MAKLINTSFVMNGPGQPSIILVVNLMPEGIGFSLLYISYTMYLLYYYISFI